MAPQQHTGSKLEVKLHKLIAYTLMYRSDGPQPHTITAQFSRKTEIAELRFYVDIKQDESYTPQVISIRTGTSLHDMKEVHKLELDNPSGWETVDFVALTGSAVRTFTIQAVILSNHQSGRDSHLRLIEVMAPRRGGADSMLMLGQTIR